MANHLHYGDNLEVLRDMPAESVDLIYLDPPFNSNASYNQLFKSPDGKTSAAQVEAFEDTWHWTDAAAAAYEDVRRHRTHSDAAQMIVALRAFLGKNDMMAAQKLGRQWIGIDITHLAIGLIEKRLRDAFADVAFTTHGVPKDVEGARDLAHLQSLENVGKLRS